MLAIDGRRETGQDVRTQNMMAALSIANIVKSSLGPVGLDKMLVEWTGVQFDYMAWRETGTSPRQSSPCVVSAIVVIPVLCNIDDGDRQEWQAWM